MLLVVARAEMGGSKTKIQVHSKFQRGDREEREKEKGVGIYG